MSTPEAAMAISEGERAQLEADAAAVIARYPQARSALLPLLHLVQSVEGFVSPAGIAFCADLLGLTPAEVAAVATFYTMFKRRPVGEYHVGVCTNTLCAVLGGDAIFASLREHLGIGHDETTEDGMVTLEHIECNAACDYAPVVMVNWEFFDNQTPASAQELVDRLRAGEEVTATRGARVARFRATERLLAGFEDGRAGQGPSAGSASLVGLDVARAHGWPGPSAAPAPVSVTAAADTAAQPSGYGPGGGPSGTHAEPPVQTSSSDVANPQGTDPGDTGDRQED
jgi:NADH-quinone oxidoreductase subunit E